MLVQTVILKQINIGSSNPNHANYVEFKSDGFYSYWACGGLLHRYIEPFKEGVFFIYNEEVPDSIKIRLGKESHSHILRDCSHDYQFLEVNDIRIMGDYYKSSLRDVSIYDKLRNVLEKYGMIWVRHQVIESAT